ncbi:electron transport complex protein RnfC [Mesocricetibacter intestinalis]|uniref:Ion-translocating oxidoreductase complex subunit C n=1 Tax=Mesocricetibacter intestinalis TaxID=1521930 RepID=A0A4R6VBS6_9PAST|nr:electron transport complex subunit RsxC [Mesocricetibacter intestinalis]TDQ59115.1 electron transport complex protein RnfC [Mesocricetibacter intestinalis]
MTDVLTAFNSGKLWDFDGGLHPPEMKSQSNRTPITQAPLASHFFVPLKQHVGDAGDLLVKIGDRVLKGQPLTRGDGLRLLPVHAPTSGRVYNIAPYIAAHPSGLSEPAVYIEADGEDRWIERQPLEDFLSRTPEQLIEKIYQAGVAGLGGAVFPTAAKIHSADKQVKLLIINGAECEPYITCDDRLMRDYAHEIIEGIRILRYILRPEKVVIAVEDNKPEAVQALRHALHGANDIEIRVIPTKYPSGASKQLIEVLTGAEVPSGQRSSSIGILMQNVGTAFAVKRAVIDDEPLIERVVTLTGDKIPQKGNRWVRLGTPISFLLQQVGYQYDERLPVYLGGPMMGMAIPDLNAPITKLANCLLAPDHFEYAPPPPEQSCIRCSACSDACPVHLMPQQLYWYARAEDHDNAQAYKLKDCIECGICAYVCPSHIPLIQYFRQEKAKIREIDQQAKRAEQAKLRFEARQARLEKEQQARKERTQQAAAARRQELAQQKGIDPVQAAIARLKAKQAEGSQAAAVSIKTIVEKGEILPDNSEIIALRQAKRLARRQEQAEQVQQSGSQSAANNDSAATDSKKAALAAAIARAKAKKAQQTDSPQSAPADSSPAEQNTRQEMQPSAPENTQNSGAEAKKAAIAAAIARAKAKKAQQTDSTQSASADSSPTEQNTRQEMQSSASESVPNSATEAKKAAIAAAIARAKAKKAQQTDSPQSAPADSSPTEQNTRQEMQSSASENIPNSATEAKKAAIAAAIARAKAKKAAQDALSNQNKE